MKNMIVYFCALFLVTPALYAEDDPVAEAQAFMKSREKREEFIKKDSKAQQADQFADKAVGGDAKAKDELYGISADIMAQLAKEGAGDPAKMQEILQKALANPEAFQKSLSPDVQARMKAVADKSSRSVNSDSKKSLKSP